MQVIRFLHVTCIIIPFSLLMRSTQGFIDLGRKQLLPVTEGMFCGPKY